MDTLGEGSVEEREKKGEKVGEKKKKKVKKKVIKVLYCKVSFFFPAFAFVPQKASPYLSIASASEALPPLLDTALLIRAPEGLDPS